MTFEIQRVTNGPKHHFFGFHDLKITDANNKYALCLEIDDISHPPLAGEPATSGFVEVGGDGTFIPCHETVAYNYPQGARQQWLGNSSIFTTNDRVGDAWGSRLTDADLRKVVDVLEFPIHSFDSNSYNAFYINYARLYRMAVYGYIGIFDPYKANIPKDDGIWIANVKTKENKLLISTYDVAKCGEKKPIDRGYPHYLTHLVLSPSGKRLAFLHRYRVHDGGEITRLMTVGTDGSCLRCLGKGFLSHFDWIDDGHIMIWGEHQPKLCEMRESLFLSNPIISPMVQCMKKIRRKYLNGQDKESIAKTTTKSFLKISDSDDAVREKIAIGKLVSDGHPMTNPVYHNKVIVDNYPDDDGNRTLMLYDIFKDEKTDLGKFRMLDNRPDESTFNIESAYYGVDPKIRKVFPHETFIFTRSGFHCDLHPRWSSDGNTAYFDSIHEGERQVYSVNLNEFLK